MKPQNLEFIDENIYKEEIREQEKDLFNDYDKKMKYLSY